MNTKEKGYSLNVLVITIAVMLILTTTAIVTMRSLTGDREITNFMSDIQEVEEFAKEYYSRKKTLPIVYRNEIPVTVVLTEEMQSQASSADKGEYYQVDLTKLEKIKLYDENREYIINENTLKVYVASPVKYNNVRYYTLTDELLGINKVYGTTDAFEVVVTGNPLTWVSNFRMTVSIPDQKEIDGNWTFKYYKKGPITAEQFKTLGTFFEYGKAIEIDENGVISIYVENAEGHVKVVNVIVTKIDEKDPFIYVSDYNEIIVGDDETGIKRIMYKIVDFTISENVRTNNIDVYLQGTREHLPNANQGGRWTYEEAYTGERIDGIEPSVGKSINTYKTEYEEYLRRYGEITSDPSGDVTLLDDAYPQFQHNGVPYMDNERNIVLYVEDYANNRSVTDKNNIMYLVSRNMLLSNNFIDVIIKPLNDASLVINNGAEYSNSREVELLIKGQGAEKMYLTTDENDVPEEDEWISFETLVNNYELPNVSGVVTLYLYVTANQREGTDLIYEVVSDKIYLDTIKPTQDAPTVDAIGNDLKFKVKSNQKDSESGIDKVEYGYKLKEETSYTWLSSLSSVTAEPSKIYEIRTRATDRAGNVQESIAVEIQAPMQVIRTLPNEPALATGMTGIVWDGTFTRPGEEKEINTQTWETLSGDKITWYNYSLGDGITDTRESIWANAKTTDGSYWVWIPRFAYKIIYYEDAAKTRVKGYYQNSVSDGMQYFESDGETIVSNSDEVKTEYVSIDVLFLNGTSSTQYREENIATTAITIKTLPAEYIVHPAFTQIEASAINNSNGKWSSELTGIWVAKFEASRSDATIDEEGTSTIVRSLPTVKSWRNIKISDAYDYCLNMYPGLYSHMMKSSEWGAVAYLSYSAYGRNGHEVSSNRCIDYITGGGGTNSSYTCSNSRFVSSYAYNSSDLGDGRSGLYASTTGNIYGVYDIAGGLEEYVATYLNNSVSAIRTNGQSLTQTLSTYLREVYTVADTDAPINNYRRNGTIDKVYGNAIYETSTGYAGNYSVDSDASNFPYGNNPFFTRGGNATDGTASGIFNFDYSTGAASEEAGFRPVISFR